MPINNTRLMSSTEIKQEFKRLEIDNAIITHDIISFNMGGSPIKSCSQLAEEYESNRKEIERLKVVAKKRNIDLQYSV